MNFRVHPKYKAKYRVQNWLEYERGLVARGNITVWLSPTAIETALTMRLVFGLPLRQAEGFLRSLFRRMDLELPVPDHTTLSRRSKGAGSVPCRDLGLSQALRKS
jgi:hypothetical protein